MTVDPPRSPHAALAMDGRYRKGRKIERLLELALDSSPRRLLEVGAGSGWISHYFVHESSGRYDVDAVDVVDNRQSKDGYRFTPVTGTGLPFADGVFDVVISNHVIEHVGDDDAQDRHLRELHRVLKSGGVGYLAVPNRWMLVEPHYRLAFLSWWPERWRSGWLRLWRKGRHYDCRPLSCGQLERCLELAGFRFEQAHGLALRATFEIEFPDNPLWRHALRHIPVGAWSLARRMFPTLIYHLRKA
ncbi:class I SAM-dependent methyltransferase [Luteimonas changyuni]|uniref:class I SAM-dependent methyltransferase n=1 Tax=Luteimonas sp. MJ145 TaxID=3129234 RepID=UPI0031BAEAFE